MERRRHARPTKVMPKLELVEPGSEKHRSGRPSTYTPEAGEKICGLLIEGYSLRQIGALPDMPHRGTIVRWMRQDDRFADAVALARREQADLMDCLILETAQQVLRGDINPHAAKVTIGAFQWRAEKLQPRKYGSRLDVTSGDRPLEDLSDEELDARVKEAMAALQAELADAEG